MKKEEIEEEVRGVCSFFLAYRLLGKGSGGLNDSHLSLLRGGGFIWPLMDSFPSLSCPGESSQPNPIFLFSKSMQDDTCPHLLLTEARTKRQHYEKMSRVPLQYHSEAYWENSPEAAQRARAGNSGGLEALALNERKTNPIDGSRPTLGPVFFLPLYLIVFFYGYMFFSIFFFLF